MKVFRKSLLFSSSLLKGLVAALQFITSIMYLRYLGAIEFGKIIAVVALAELALLFALPGIQKAVLKIVAIERFPLNLYIMKSLFASIVFFYLFFQLQGAFYLAVVFLICTDNFLALNRTSLHAKKAFNLLVSLDTIRPSIAIILLASALYWQIAPNKQIYVVVLFLSMIVEFIICAPFIFDTYRKFELSDTKIIDLLGNSMLASGFSYGSTILRKLPIVVAGSLAAELSALVSIFLQFFTLINYLISAVMLQVSIKLLNKEIRITNIFSVLSKQNVFMNVFIFSLYYVVILLLDYTKFYWLPVIFNYEYNIPFSIFAFSFLPLVSFFSQLQFYNLFSKSSWLSYYFIFVNMLIHFFAGAGFYYLLKWGFVGFEFAVFYFHGSVLVFLFLSDIAFGKLEKSRVHR
ncbi:hypothetical protein OAH99_00450 [Planktomarina sp.]|nr:hypothetical protein [Planktomarina sp.]